MYQKIKGLLQNKNKVAVNKRQLKCKCLVDEKQDGGMPKLAFLQAARPVVKLNIKTGLCSGANQAGRKRRRRGAPKRNKQNSGSGSKWVKFGTSSQPKAIRLGLLRDMT
jgi:hypothetical protein